jgi:Fe-S-cluster containining protein
MLVRLQQDEMEPGDGITAVKGFVDKDPEGYCVHIDRDSGFCHNWENRPKVCREYTCNSDFMLQVVLQEGFVNIAELAKASVRVFIPKETYRYIPTLNDPNFG